MTPCPFCHRAHDDPYDGCEWDWSGIRTRERLARLKARGLPKCRLCTGPMWLDQRGIHHICKEATT
jgi:hypothetical protein